MKPILTLSALMLALPTALPAAEPLKPSARPNVLFTAADDLRTALEARLDATRILDWVAREPGTATLVS